MKYVLMIFLPVLFCGRANVCLSQQGQSLAPGQQPQLSIDKAGVIRLVFGEQDNIYCATSTDNGQSFKDIQLVATIKDMHLGMSRGPQLTSSVNYSMIAAIDKRGSVHSFVLAHATKKWKECSLINDIAGSAPEGLMSLTSDNKDNFCAVWLDIRNDQHNKICFARTSTQGQQWSSNRVAYISPDNNVCECCKPAMVVSGSKIYIQFRNWLNGARDLYLLTSVNGGQTFAQPEKLGMGTWKIKGCPMDGGGIAVTEDKQVTTVWRREDKVYLAKPGSPEVEIATGRNCSITNPSKPIITWQEGAHLKVKELQRGTVTDVGTGGFIKAVKTKDNKILCAWEADGQIEFSKI